MLSMVQRYQPIKRCKRPETVASTVSALKPAISLRSRADRIRNSMCGMFRMVGSSGPISQEQLILNFISAILIHRVILFEQFIIPVSSSNLYILIAGTYIATCGFNKTIQILDFFSGELIAQVSGHSELVTAIKFSPDGRYRKSSYW